MPRHLILMRHAKSAWPGGVSDFERPLAPRGEAAAPLMGQWLEHVAQKWKPVLRNNMRQDKEIEHDFVSVETKRALGGLSLKPEAVLVSPARRTRETWALVAPFLGGLPMRIEPDIYQADVASLLGLLRELPDAIETVLMVGHNPGMQELAYHLADPARSDRDALGRLSRKYPTAGVAMLETDTPFAEAGRGSMRLVTFMTPRFLGGVDED